MTQPELGDSEFEHGEEVGGVFFDGNLWFTEFMANKIGRITPSGTITEFVVPTASSEPQAIKGHIDGTIWLRDELLNETRTKLRTNCLDNYRIG
jgi:streptogramin lyase